MTLNLKSVQGGGVEGIAWDFLAKDNIKRGR